MPETVTADEIKTLLKLEPNATCGFVRETYKSDLTIAPGGLPAPFADGRPLGTALIFMVTPEAPVKLHRIDNEQLYHYYLGDPIEVLLLRENGDSELVVVGPNIVGGHMLQLYIPGNTFHTARVTGKRRWFLGASTEWPGVVQRDRDVEFGDIDRARGQISRKPPPTSANSPCRRRSSELTGSGSMTVVLVAAARRAQHGPSGLTRSVYRSEPNPVPSGDRLPQRHAVPGRDPEQLGGAPNQIRLEFVYDAVGHHHFPQHLDDPLAAVLVELAAKNVGEAVKIDRFVLLLRGFPHQPAHLFVVELELLPQQGLERPAFGRIELSVDHRRVHQQRRGSQTQLVLAKIPRRLVIAGDEIDEFLEPGPDRH